MTFKVNDILIIQVAVILVSLLAAGEGFKALYISTVPSPSHGSLAQGYIRALVKKGHQVTFISPFPMKESPANVTQIDLTFLFDFMTEEYDLSNYKFLKEQSETNTNVLHDWMRLMIKINQWAFESDVVKNFINDKKQNFDLVIVDWFFSEFFAGFAALYECPLIYSSSLDAHSGILRMIDDVANPAYTDDVMVALPKPYTFLQRVNMLWNLLSNIYIVESERSVEETNYEKVFSKAAESRGIKLPPYKDVIYNASLVLANSHPSFGSSVTIPQNFKPLLGYHIEVPTKPLPSDLQNIMDQAKHGVIYFSFGTNVKAKVFPKEIREALIKMFAGLKQTVLWKFDEEMKDLPKNIIIRKWMPQSSILAHPNLKVFITHGGLLSTTETIHHGVPIIGVPLFGDQFLNMKRSVMKGFAVHVKLSDNLADDLKGAIGEILANPSYAATAKRLSSLYHDRPVPPSEELVYWLEYAVRTGGAPHLRSAALLLPWYQRLYLDLLALIIAALLVLILLVKSILNSCKRKQKQVKKKLN